MKICFSFMYKRYITFFNIFHILIISLCSIFRSKDPEYDSWGEESDDDEEDENAGGRRTKYKPKPYPQQTPVMDPFAMYYPPPPRGKTIKI